MRPDTTSEYSRNAKSQHPTYSGEAHTVEVEVEKALEEVRLKIFARYSILPELVQRVQGEMCAELVHRVQGEICVKEGGKK